MAHSLSIELLSLIASLASKPTLAALARVSTTTYAISIRPLYTSIPYMNRTRVILCLRTLAQHPSLACLVRSCTIIITTCPLYNLSYAFSHLAPRAFEQMTNLTELSLRLHAFTNSSILARARFKLRNLACVISSHSTYPITQFLISQPTIESLVITCDPQDIILGLPRDALPILRNVAAPFALLPPLLSTRLSHITRISARLDCDWG
ncbi:hypothetical protein FRC10_012081 [Ceratobasidium sp. 414]|nr:hypothetical protein FRC10_012081 [Ceratobasidium sp. 414]